MSSSSLLAVKEQAAQAVAKVQALNQTTKTFPPFRTDLPKRIHVPKHVKTADLRMRIALKSKPRDFRREHLVITTSRTRRDALPLEKLGEWDPEPRMRRLLPSSLPGHEEADLSFAGRPATRFEKRIELSGDKIKWWLEKGGAKPTKAVVRLLEDCGLLIKGEHPFSYKPKDRPITQQKPSGHWPEYDEPTPARAPGAIVRGTTYILPHGLGSGRKEALEAATAAAEAKLAEDLVRKRTEKAEARATEVAERVAAKAAKLAEREAERAKEVEAYRSKVDEVSALKRAMEIERAYEHAAARAAKAEAEAKATAEAAAAAKASEQPAATTTTAESSAPSSSEEVAANVESTTSTSGDDTAASTPPPPSSPAPEDK